MENNTELTEYIRSSLQQGFSKEEIKKQLLTVGWDLTMVNAHLDSIDSTASTSAVISPPSSSVVDSSKFSYLIYAPILVGLVLVIVFMAVTFLSGKTIYKSENMSFDTINSVIEKNLDLTTDQNPYRILLKVSYQMNGEPFGSSYDLFSYSYDIADTNGDSVKQGNKTISYSRNGQSDSDKTNNSNSNQTISAEITTFSVTKDGPYKFTMPIEIKSNIDQHFTLKDLSYEVKGGVIILPPVMVFIGFALVAIPLAIIFFRSWTNH